MAQWIFMTNVQHIDGSVSGFVLRGELKHVARVLKRWSSASFTAEGMSDVRFCTVLTDDAMIATLAYDIAGRHWYLVRLMD